MGSGDLGGHLREHPQLRRRAGGQLRLRSRRDLRRRDSARPCRPRRRPRRRGGGGKRLGRLHLGAEGRSTSRPIRMPTWSSPAASCGASSTSISTANGRRSSRIRPRRPGPSAEPTRWTSAPIPIPTCSTSAAGRSAPATSIRTPIRRPSSTIRISPAAPPSIRAGAATVALDAVFAGTDTTPASAVLTLTAPNSGGTITLGDPLTITWTATGFAGTLADRAVARQRDDLGNPLRRHRQRRQRGLDLGRGSHHRRPGEDHQPQPGRPGRGRQRRDLHPVPLKARNEKAGSDPGLFLFAGCSGDQAAVASAAARSSEKAGASGAAGAAASSGSAACWREISS